jgi:Protein of unknown function (DUF3768)
MACRRRPAHLTRLLTSPLYAAWNCRVFHPAGVRAACLAHNDPYGEHDFGNFTLAGRKFFWKIDAYDANMEFGSEDPADPSQTTRVLTIMLAEEY